VRSGSKVGSKKREQFKEIIFINKALYYVFIAYNCGVARCSRISLAICGTHLCISFIHYYTIFGKGHSLKKIIKCWVATS